MAYTGSERRKHPRIFARFIVSYRVLEQANSVDVSQTKNISVGGMLLTTNKSFPKDTRLALEIRLPFAPRPITLIGKVVESKEVTTGLIYDTRLEFLPIDEKQLKIVKDTVEFHLRKP